MLRLNVTSASRQVSRQRHVKCRVKALGEAGRRCALSRDEGETHPAPPAGPVALRWSLEPDSSGPPSRAGVGVVAGVVLGGVVVLGPGFALTSSGCDG